MEGRTDVLDKQTDQPTNEKNPDSEAYMKTHKLLLNTVTKWLDFFLLHTVYKQMDLFLFDAIFKRIEIIDLFYRIYYLVY